MSDLIPISATQQAFGTNPEVFWTSRGTLVSYVWNGGTSWTNTNQTNQPGGFASKVTAIRGGSLAHVFDVDGNANPWVTDNAQ